MSATAPHPQPLYELAPACSWPAAVPAAPSTSICSVTSSSTLGCAGAAAASPGSSPAGSSAPTRSPMPTSTTPAPRPGCAAPWACPCGAGPAMPPRSPAVGSTATARRCQPAPADPGAGHRPPGQPHPPGRRRGGRLRGAGGPGAFPGRAGVLAGGDRVLVCGDVLANVGLHPARPHLVLAPAALSSDCEENRRSARRLAGLRPRLACFGHGFAVSDPGRFAAAVEQLQPASS